MTFVNTSDSSLSGIFVQNWNSRNNIEQRAIYVIEKNPTLYLGIPKEFLFIIELLSEKCQLPRIDIYVTLKKIKLNLPYEILVDDFCLAAASICNVIKRALPKLTVCVKPFIQWKTIEEIRENLPIPFRHRYKNCETVHN
ncbi:hypothetical protein NQ314_003479 [Rhamnusium bicolor]|uniref:Uncharacterized protein n=1 Tax=Rhamnusium bicolor TaxID=1586634 RepID=A0AAV8ZMP2_9CUCU|nr:hypothetical protein NQ314_003479 [Rhamnusium bicolor]